MHLQKVSIMKRFFCLLAMLVSSSYSAQAAIVEVITNGGFEAGNVGFTTEFDNVSPGLAFNPGTLSVTDPVTTYFGVDAYEGDWMLTASVFDQPFVEKTLWAQDIWLEAGVTYELSTYFADTTGAGNLQFAYRLNGAQFISFNSFGIEDLWSGVFTPISVLTSGFYSLSLMDLTDFPGVGVRYAIDNISLTYEVPDTQVSAPAGGLLLLATLICFLGLRRKVF
jgi:hypothetical protein